MESWRRNLSVWASWVIYFLIPLGATEAMDSTTRPPVDRTMLRSMADSAGVPMYRLEQFDYSWIITGSPDPRFRVHGHLKDSDGACRTMHASWQGSRTGQRTACQCDKIFYNSMTSPLRRCSLEELRTKGLVTGCIDFSGKQSSWLDIGIKFIEASVCYPGPCCDMINEHGATVATPSPNDLPEIYLQLPYMNSSGVGCRCLLGLLCLLIGIVAVLV